MSSSECLAEEKIAMHLISYTSTATRRACRLVVATETNALQGSLEDSIRMRATVIVMEGKLNVDSWGSSSAGRSADGMVG